MAQHWDDFSGASPLARYTEAEQAADAAASVVADAGAPSGNGLRMSSTGASGGFPTYSLLRNDLAAQSDWEAATCYRYSGSGETHAGVSLRSAIAPVLASLRGYIYEVWFSGHRDLFRQTSSNTSPVGTELATLSGTAPAANTRRGMRTRVVGGAVKGKDWLWDTTDPPGAPVVSVAHVGVASAQVSGSAFVPSDFGEPGAWTLEATDGVPLAAGSVALTAEFQPSGDPLRTYSFDFLSITDAPAAESAALHDPGASAQDATQVRVKKVSDDSVVYDSGTIAATTGPHTATGLVLGEDYYAEMRYRDARYSVWGAWGVSAPFSLPNLRMRVTLGGEVYTFGASTMDAAEGPALRLTADGALVSYGGAAVAEGASQVMLTPDGLDCVALHERTEFGG